MMYKRTTNKGKTQFWESKKSLVQTDQKSQIDFLRRFDQT